MTKFQRWFLNLVKVAVAASVVFIFYIIYLDSVVTGRFTHARYQAPALLYSQSMVLNAEQPLSMQRIVDELRALDYRHSRYARNPGEFQQQEGQLLLHRRSFDLPDRFLQSKRVRLLFDTDQQLQAIEEWPSQNMLPSLVLEPQFLGRFASDSGEDRLLVGLEQVPVLMQETLLLIEDQHFYHHRGVRPSAIARAAVANLSAGRTVQGGSTITQQLVKNMFLSREQTYIRKINEALMALILDYRFSKDEILEAYFNEVYFGQDRGHAIHGIALASQFFFGTTVEALSVEEIATLIGMIKGPALYEPRRFPERSKSRRDLVLRLMYEHDLISQTQYLAAIERPVSTRDGTRLARFNRPDFIDLVQQELRALLPDRSWQETGLRVFTTFSPSLQQSLEYAARSSTQAQSLGDWERAMVLTDFRTGAVRALVGGKSPVFGGFNRALSANRPIGSLVKPWVYAVALEQPERFQLASLLDDSPLSMTDERNQVWAPRNFDGEFVGPITLYQSLVDSRNIPVVRVGMEVTPNAVRERILRTGVRRSIHPWPSLFLGAVELSPLDVNRVYAGLANQGRVQQQHAITAITTHRGDLLYAFQGSESEGNSAQVFSKESAYLVTHALKGAVEKGTARALASYSPHLAGKTGSTNDLRDSWFVSYDGAHVLTVWVGADDNQPVGLTGSRGALPLAAAFWEQGLQPGVEELPDTLYTQYVHPLTGGQVGAHCEGALALPAIMTEAGTLANFDCRGRMVERTEHVEPEAQETRRSWWRRVFN